MVPLLLHLAVESRCRMCLLSPIAAVLIADYLLVKRMRIDLVALFETDGPYWYWKGVNPVAVIWTALGFLAYMFVIPPESIRVLVTLLATGAGYWATMQLLSPYFAWLTRASHPGEQREAIEDLVQLCSAPAIPSTSASSRPRA